MVTVPTRTARDVLRELMCTFYLTATAITAGLRRGLWPVTIARRRGYPVRCTVATPLWGTPRQNRHNAAMAARIVYSTGIGSLCPNCRRAVIECVCPKGAPGVRPGGAAVRVGREVKGRAGKGVSTVTGLPLAPAEIEALATQLKKRCGSGGTVRDGVIEIQGEHRDVIVAELIKLGWPVKKSGG